MYTLNYSSSFTVTTTSFNQKQYNNNNRIEEIIDRIDALRADTAQTIKDIHKYFDFLLKNPLKQFIPKTKLFNGRAFHEYEEEFLIQYTILKSKTS